MRSVLAAVSALMVLTGRGTAAQSVPDSLSRPLRWSTVVIAGGVVAATAFLVDGPVARSIRDHPSADRLSIAATLQRFGTGVVIGPTVGTLAVVGLLTKRKPLRNLAFNTAEAAVIASLASNALKFTIGRERPSDDPDLKVTVFAPFSGEASFPSGHAAAAFAFATSMGEAVNRPWARVGLYALATGTAWARVARGAHWVSDVVGGAAIGIVSAKLASGRRTIFGVRAPRFGINQTGFQLSWDALPWRPSAP